MNKLHVIIISKHDFSITDIPDATQVNISSGAGTNIVVYRGSESQSFAIANYDIHVLGVKVVSPA